MAASAYQSPPIDDHELVCRGAYVPTHYNKKGSLRPSFIERKTLEAGELSVWRCGNDNDVPALGAKLVREFDREGRTISEIFAMTGSELRGLKVPNDTQRAFSVLNDTRVDFEGTEDPQHAAISPCRRFYSDGSIPTAEMEQLINLLLLKYQLRPVWPNADQNV